MDPNSEADDGGVWITCAELARRKGISRQAAAKRVASLEGEGKIRTRKDGKTRLVDLAAYDKAVGEVGDAVKEQAAETSRGNASPAMRDAQTERAQYEARLKALDLGERQRQLLPINGEHGIDAAASAIGVRLAQDLDGMVRFADEMAQAVSKEGTAGARRLFKEIARRTREQLMQSLAEIAAQGEAAEKGGLIETELSDPS